MPSNDLGCINDTYNEPDQEMPKPQSVSQEVPLFSCSFTISLSFCYLVSFTEANQSHVKKIQNEALGGMLPFLFAFLFHFCKGKNRHTWIVKVG